MAQLITPVCFVSVDTQTEDASPLNADDFHQLHLSDNISNTLSNAPIDVVHSSNKPDCSRSDRDDCDSDSDNSIVNDACFESELENTDASDEDEFLLNAKEAHEDKHEKVVLSYNKLPENQMKFIVFEESLVNVSNAVSSVTQSVLCV